jgi:hypothetical protein
LAGKKDSNANSENVMSTGVPKTVVVLRNERTPPSVTNWNGTASCDRELGYQPHELRRRTSQFDLEFLPRVDSLQSDSTDLLDP